MNDEESNRARIEKATKLIKAALDVDEIIDGDFASNADDKVCITYVSMIFKAF